MIGEHIPERLACLRRLYGESARRGGEGKHRFYADLMSVSYTHLTLPTN